MKFAKLSMVAIAALGLIVHASAADTLADAFKNGKVNGELKAYYFNLDVNQPSRKAYLDASLLDTGVKLGYVTDSFYGLKLGATFQSSYSPFADIDAKKQFGGDMYGPGAVLSELYLDYTLNKTDVRIGRQGIGAITPLVRGSRSRMIEESFEGVMFINKDIPSTILTGGYISQFQARTSVAGGTDTNNFESSIATFEKKIVFSNPLYIVGAVPFDGAYTLGAINKSIQNTVLVGNYVKVNDVIAPVSPAPGAPKVKGDIDIYYAEVLHTIPMDGYKLGFDAMYVGSRLGSELGNKIALNGDYYGVRASIKELKGFGVEIAYGTTSKDDGVIDSFGNGGMVYTGTEIGGPINEVAKDTVSYVLGLSYDFNAIGVKGLKTTVAYGFADQDFSGIESTSKVFTANYDVSSVKGLCFGLDYEIMDQEQKSVKINQRDEMRFRAIYKF